MRILFVSGGSGSGKTTVCNYLKEKYHIPCIYVDDIVAEYHLGEEYISLVLAYRKYYDKKCKGIYKSVISDDGINPIIKNQLKKLIAILNDKVNEMLMEKENNNENYVAIDFLVPTMLTCFDKANVKIRIEKSNENRLLALNKRKRRFAVYTSADNELTESNLFNRDIYSFYESFHSNNQDFDVIIENENTVEDLYEKIDEIMENFKIKSSYYK